MNSIKFHQSYSYTDTKMGIKVEFNLSVVGNRLVGVHKSSHPKFPTVTSIFEGLIPTKMIEREIELKKDERKNRIKDLVFGGKICVTETNDMYMEVPMN